VELGEVRSHVVEHDRLDLVVEIVCGGEFVSPNFASSLVEKRTPHHPTVGAMVQSSFFKFRQFYHLVERCTERQFEAHDCVLDTQRFRIFPSHLHASIAVSLYAFVNRYRNKLTIFLFTIFGKQVHESDAILSPGNR